ncbi:LSM domain-containing protein [Aureococcus anophagefferens]|nr:LSM domain-containing protein [Aureococcus anophagefferens]
MHRCPSLVRVAAIAAALVAARAGASDCYTLTLRDSWGDGWNGAEWVFQANETFSEGTLDSGLVEEVSLCVASAPTCFAFEVRPGSYDSEISWDFDLVGVEGAAPFARTAKAVTVRKYLRKLSDGDDVEKEKEAALERLWAGLIDEHGEHLGLRVVGGDGAMGEAAPGGGPAAARGPVVSSDRIDEGVGSSDSSDEGCAGCAKCVTKDAAREADMEIQSLAKLSRLGPRKLLRLDLKEIKALRAMGRAIKGYFSLAALPNGGTRRKYAQQKVGADGGCNAGGWRCQNLLRGISRVCCGDNVSHSVIGRFSTRRIDGSYKAAGKLARHRMRALRSDLVDLACAREYWHQNDDVRLDTFAGRCTKKVKIVTVQVDSDGRRLVVKEEHHQRHTKHAGDLEIYQAFLKSAGYASHLAAHPSHKISFTLFKRAKCPCIAV